MSRDHLAGATLGTALTAVLGWLWYRHWSGLPEVRQAYVSGGSIPPPADQAEQLMSVLTPGARVVDRDQWCGEWAIHRPHHLCGGVIERTGRVPSCSWGHVVHDAHPYLMVDEDTGRSRVSRCEGAG